LDSEIIRQAWSLLETVTPLRVDCGSLCQGACCKESDAGEGMLLFPGEAERMCDFPGGVLDKVDLPGYGKADFFLCQGVCNRSMRPLSCRIFPLAPKSGRNGVWTSRLDVRGRPICPLSRGPKGALRREFISACEDVFNLIAREEDGERFLSALEKAERAYVLHLW